MYVAHNEQRATSTTGTRYKISMGAALYIIAVLSLGLVAGITGTTSLYVDKENPYKNGTLPVQNFTLSKPDYDVPLHTIVYYPAAPGQYASLLFVGGFYGAVPAELAYTDLLRRVAAHGFVVLGVYLPLVSVRGSTTVRTGTWMENLPESHADTSLMELDWARKHLNTHLSNRTAGVSVDWERVGLLCHSAGCDVTLRMILQNRTAVNATAFLEPFSIALSGGRTVDFRMPALMYGAELCQKFPPCCIKGFDWNHFYDHWSCPRALLESKNQGHCDVLDQGVTLKDCDHICHKGNADDWEAYHTFIQGLVSAFFISTLQGVHDWHYVTNTTEIPISVMNAKNDINC